MTKFSCYVLKYDYVIMCIRNTSKHIDFIIAEPHKIKDDMIAFNFSMLTMEEEETQINEKEE